MRNFLGDDEKTKELVKSSMAPDIGLGIWQNWKINRDRALLFVPMNTGALPPEAYKSPAPSVPVVPFQTTPKKKKKATSMFFSDFNLIFGEKFPKFRTILPKFEIFLLLFRKYHFYCARLIA